MAEGSEAAEPGVPGTGVPRSGASGSGPPGSGAPRPGASESGAPGNGAPGSGARESSAPGSGAPGSGAPGSGAPGSGAAGSGPSSKRTISTGRNLPIAVAVGVGMGALVLLSLFTVKATFLIYMGAAVAMAGWELSRALGTAGIRLAAVPLGAGGVAMWTSAYWIGPRAALATAGLATVAVLAWRLPRGAAGYLRDATAGVFTLVYLPLLATFVVLMLASSDGAKRVLVFIALTVCNDIGGYFAGILLGRHPLVPRISPKKTWEGLAGSAVVCVGAGMGLLPWLLHGHLWQGAVTGAAAVAAATLGDLVESMIKRDLDVKDMGTVLPGHGGIMDRLDSLLANAPVAWLLLALFVPAGAH